MSSSADDDDDYPSVIKDFRRYLGPKKPLDDRSAIALPVAAIKALLDIVSNSKANTMMGLQDELKQGSATLIAFATTGTLLGGRSHIALASGCELFLKYITRTFLETPNFDACKHLVLERGQHFATLSLSARDSIAKVGQGFIQQGQTVLTHGASRVVASLLLRAAETKHFDVVLLEGRPDASGAKAAELYAKAGIPTRVVLDSAMGYIMESIDLVLVGAEGVVENGGIVNKMGTYALATIAQACGKPVYVAAESYKFARLYPLNQSDLPAMGHTSLDFVDTVTWQQAKDKESSDFVVTLPVKVNVTSPPCDYTPAKFITLLFTDLGVLTPSAVSDELIRLYQ